VAFLGAAASASLATPDDAVGLVSKWQLGLGLRPLAPVCFPGYQRLDRPFYGELAVRLRAAARFDLGAALAYPRFRSVLPRVLLLRSGYFLEREIAEGLDSLGAEHRAVDAAMADRKGDVRFVERLLAAVLEFKPDFVLAVNHLGVDRDGALHDLLGRLRLPLASWFVDSPHLILYRYAGLVGGRTAIFTFDSATLPLLRDMGFAESFYLPLGTSMATSGRDLPETEESIDVSFVGESMLGPVRKLMDESGLPGGLKRECGAVAAEFAGSGDYTVGGFLDRRRPDLRKRLDGLKTPEQRLAFERIVTFEATRQYRAACVRRLLPFGPVIHGDEGWGRTLGTSSRTLGTPPGQGRVRIGWSHRPPVEYYRELPGVYQATRVNFNCTSLQMKQAVNQRVFDVPARGRFVLTDARPQLDGLFEPGLESATYGSPEEIPELVRFYLDNPEARRKIARAARRRVLAEHTYVHRLRTLLQAMRETFG
jgi:spore maturation protein CgeB